MAALSGIRVIDFGQYIAGPVAGMLLADQGAEVVKIDPPGGPVYKTPANATWNRGKKSICLNLKKSSDVEIAKQLVARADILLENFRPGVMARLGLAKEDLMRTNPALIYASMPGFAANDARAQVPGWEGIIMAATDVFRPIAEYRDMIQMLHQKPCDRNGTPVFSSEAVASTYAGLIASFAITTALYTRMTGGKGQSIEVSLFDAMLQAVGILAMARMPFVPVTGPVFSGFDHQYLCSDNRWVHIVATVPRHGELFLEAINRKDLIEQGLAKRGLAAKPDLNTLLIETLTSVFATRTALEWENLFVDTGIPGAMCRSSAEWMDHPQAQQSDLLVSLNDPVLGPVRQPGLQVKLSLTPGKIANPAPLPDEHRSEILAMLETPALNSTIANSKNKEPDFPLKGIKVLDLCIILAGPTCGRSLAELGAEVIKIDDPARGEVLYHHDINRGKQSILLDLKSTLGLELFWKLVDDADVIVQNYRNGVVQQLGIDYAAVKARKPEIIYVSLNAFGDNGPWEQQPGYEEVAQALTGMQVRFGGEDKPILWPYGVVNDYGTGFAGAFGVLMALVVRLQSGKGQHVSSALARTANTLQSAWLIDYEGKQWNEPCGPDTLGYNALQRLYKCKDSWIFIGAGSAQHLKTLVKNTSEDTLEADIETWCGNRSSVTTIELLTNGDTAAHKLVWFNEMASDPAQEARGVIVTREHNKLGVMRTTGPAQWFSDSKIDAGCPAPLQGSDAATILEKLNLTSQDLEDLVKAEAIKLP